MLKLDQRLFHTRDLALLWKITNKNTLYTTIKRYLKKGILIPIHKGFYSTVPLKQIDPVRLGIGYLHDFAYLSLEAVLVKNGLIFQHSNYITLISSRSARFTVGTYNYLVKKLDEKYLYNRAGIIEEKEIYLATSERAVADTLYFNPRYYFDSKNKIDWKKVKAIQKEVGYR